MERSSGRVGAAGLALAACLALGACGGGASGGGGAQTGPAARPAAQGAGGEAPADAPSVADDAPAGPNFRFVVGEAYRNDPSTSAPFVAQLEGFFEGALAPLQRLPGLLPRTVSVVYDRCGEANAFHYGATDRIVLCHELAEYAYGLFGSGPGSNDPEGDLRRDTLLVLSAMGFVLYHEIGHALDFQRGLPIAGNVESAVDSIATVIAVETGKPLYATAGAAVFGEEPPSLAARHGGGLDRGGDIVCWTVGGDEFARSQLVDPEIRDVFAAAGRDCIAEYAGQRDTVRLWLPGLARLDADGSSSPGAATDAFRFVAGERWLAGAGSDPATRARVERLVEGFLASLEDEVSGLPHRIDVVYDACGAARSSYDPATRTIELCEELVEAAYRYEIDLIDAETASERAFALQGAYAFLEFVIHHELGHALRSIGRIPRDENVESAADAIGTVLLVESGRAVAAFDTPLLVFEQPPAQAAAHAGAEALSRADDMLCLMLGGDAALQAEPRFADLVARYVDGERDCVAEYRERRDDVATWLRGG